MACCGRNWRFGQIVYLGGDYNNEIQLPSPQIIRTTVEKVLKAFENVIQTELIRVRWEQIKKLQVTAIP